MPIVKAFDRASDYDTHARVQREVASRLAARIGALSLPKNPRVLEIGCGTGFLGEALLPLLAPSTYWMTDIAPTMIQRAQSRFADDDGLRFEVMDGSQPNVEGPFDLICSSLAMQWMPDLGGAVQRLRTLLAPGGQLAFTTMAQGSFQEWRAAHPQDGSGTHDYPGQEELRALGLSVETQTIIEAHGSAAAFLKSLKAIGAGTPRPGHKPLPPAQLRLVMRKFEEEGAAVRYVIATCFAGPAR